MSGNCAPEPIEDEPTDKQVMCFGCMERARKLLEAREETEVQRLANVELVKKLDESLARELEQTKKIAQLQTKLEHIDVIREQVSRLLHPQYHDL